MDILKSPTKPLEIPEQSDTGRRSFLWKMGAAMSAALASVVPGKSSPATGQGAADRLKILEDEKAIRRLHQAYEHCLHNGKYEDVPGLFSEDGEAIFNGGIFKGKTEGLQRLYTGRFQSGLTGRKIEPAPGFQPDTGLPRESIKVAADRKSAEASFSYSIQVGAPMNPDSQLVRMARLHGEGILKWWEAGTCEVTYVNNAGEDGWKIKRLEYRALSQADYRPGKSRATPISVPLFSEAYPGDPAGPDAFIDQG